DGIHNILEPAAFGLPVFFGPQHEKFIEARQFKREGFAFSIESVEDYKIKLSALLQENHWHSLSQHIVAFMQKNRGATNTIFTHLKEEINYPFTDNKTLE